MYNRVAVRSIDACFLARNGGLHTDPSPAKRRDKPGGSLDSASGLLGSAGGSLDSAGGSLDSAGGSLIPASRFRVRVGDVHAAVEFGQLDLAGGGGVVPGVGDRAGKAGQSPIKNR